MLKTIGAVTVALLIGLIAGGWWMHGHVKDKYQAKVSALQASVASAQSVMADQRAKVVQSQKDARAAQERVQDALTAVEASAHKAKAMNASFHARLQDAKRQARADAACPPVLQQHLPASVGTDY